jgi:Ulp1 family protease
MDVSKQQDLAPEKMGKVDDWTREELLKVPQQRNGTDCGIFALLFARFAVIGAVQTLNKFTFHTIDAKCAITF